MVFQIIFIVLLIVEITLYIIVRKRYSQMFESLNQKQYPLRQMLPMGYLLLAETGYRYQTNYDRRMASRFNELYGPKEGQRYLRIHWANQVTMVLIIFLILSIFAVALEDSLDREGILAVLLLPAAAVYGLNQEVNQQVKRRQMLLKLDFTEFLNKLILLLNAGMNLSRAWQKITEESESERPLYHELRVTLAEIRGGRSEAEAYEDFANRCRTPEIFKFITLVLQNMKKGSGEMVGMLRLLSSECWIMRKNTAKLLGEEASTKLLFPMMVMFFAIILIVMTPAILALSQM